MKQFILYTLFILPFVPLNAVSNSIKENCTEDLLTAAFQDRLRMDAESNLFHLEKAEKQIDKNTPILTIAKIYAELSKHHLVNGEFDKAKIYLNKADNICNRCTAQLPQAYASFAWATYYNFLDIADLAVENLQRTLDILNQEEDLKLRARVYYTLYAVYSSWENEMLSVQYAQKAILAAKESEYYELWANALSAKATTMEYAYRKTKNSVYLDSIPIYLKASTRLYQQHPDKVGVRTYAIANLNIANYFFKHKDLSLKQTQDSILLYSFLTKKIAESFDKNYEIRSNVNGLLAEIAIEQNDLREAEKLLLESYNSLNTTSTPSFYTLSNVAGGLSKVYEKIGTNKKALFYLQEKQRYDKVYFDSGQAYQATKLNAQYENKRLKGRILLIQQTAQARQKLNFLMAGIIGLLVVSSILGYLFLKNKSKLQKEEQGRLKAEQALMLLQHKQMQKEVMTRGLHVERKNAFLQEMRNTLRVMNHSRSTQEYDKVLKHEMRIEKALEKNLVEFQDINPLFFEKINTLAETKLTPLDLKYCAYIHLKLSNKELAQIFNVSPNSIRVTKYRLKQKLGLDKTIDLNKFLKEI